MDKLPKFLFCENKTELPGAGWILCTEPPFFIGQVIKGDGVVCMANVVGYKIGINLFDALADEEGWACDIPENEVLAREMAEFYHEEKIKPNLRYYRRYLE